MNTTKIDKLIGSYEKKVVMLRELKALVISDPQTASEVIRAIAPDNISSVSTKANSKPKKKSQRDLMIDLLQDGHWRTLQEVANEIGAKKSSIAPYVYVTKGKNLFESRDNPGNAREKQWRLKVEPEQTSIEPTE